MSLSVLRKISVEFVPVFLPKSLAILYLPRFPTGVTVQLFGTPLGELVGWKRLLATKAEQRLATLLLNFGFTCGL